MSFSSVTLDSIDNARGIDSSTARLAFDAGRSAYLAETAEAEKEKHTRAASQKKAAGKHINETNGVEYSSNIKVKKTGDQVTAITVTDKNGNAKDITLNARQKAGIRAAEMLASIGVNVHVFLSQTDTNGKPVGENGSYSLKDGSIHIDLNAGNSGQGVMAYTIAHEFTHFMEQQSPNLFQQFTDALFASVDMDVEAEIAAKAEKLRQQRPDAYRNASKQKLMDDARSEVVAECCETMLTDTDAAERIARNIQAKDKTLWEKVVQWFRDLGNRMREAYKGLDPDSQIAGDAKKTIQQVDGLVQMWADMAVDAAGNYRNAEAGEKSGVDSSKQYSMRDIEIDRRFVDFNDREGRDSEEDITANNLIKKGKAVKINISNGNPIITDTNWSNSADSRKSIREILKSYLGEDVQFEHNGQYATAYLTQKGIDHAVSGMNTKNKALAVNQFKQLIANAEYSYSSESDHQKNNDNIDWDYFVSVADFDGEYLPIVFAIRTIDSDVRSQIYSVATKENPGSFRGAGTQNNTANGHPSYEESLSSDRIISDMDDGVKRSERDSDYMELAKDPEKNLERLKKDLRNLKELVKLQGTVTEGKIARPETLTTAANAILKDAMRTMDAKDKPGLIRTLEILFQDANTPDMSATTVEGSLMDVAAYIDRLRGMTMDKENSEYLFRAESCIPSKKELIRKMSSFLYTGKDRFNLFIAGYWLFPSPGGECK